MLPGYCTKPLERRRTQFSRTCGEFLVLQLLERGLGSRTSHWVRVERSGQWRFAVRVDATPRVHDSLGPEYRCKRHAAGEGLSYANEIRHHAFVLEGESPARA